MNPHRLRAPSRDGAVLADPPIPDALPLLADNTERLKRWDYDFQGRVVGRLRLMAWRQILEKSVDYLTSVGLDVPALPDPSVPLIVTGHQPELFHPGVWIKNFGAAALAKKAGGSALNLIVDNDLPKATSVRVPVLDREHLRTQRVDFDSWGGETPYEDLNVVDEERFAQFAGNVREALGKSVADPIIDDFWPRAMEQKRSTRRIGLRFAAARRSLEASWGMHNLEVPLSAMCETEAFHWFTSHILANLPRFQAIHNSALARYRAMYGIRSKHHPVPALTRRDGWLEAPFWIWRADEPRRRPLLARQLPRSMELRIDGEDEPLMEIPLGPDREACCAVDQLLTLPARRIRLRSRALTTTMFSRLLLGNIFIHGIGGAKYDELGDEIVRQFFRIEPPSYLTLSMTLWLGLGNDPSTPDQLHRVDRTLRDLTYNPDRYLNGAPSSEALGWVEAKRRAILAPQVTPQERKARFLEIRRCNEALQPLMVDTRQQLTEEQAEVRQGLRRNALARNREYSLVLHSESRLRDALAEGDVWPG